MLIALPPSEGKTAPRSGPVLDLKSLAIPQFTVLRHGLIAELEDVSARDDAMSILGVGSKAEHEVAAQRTLRAQPCAPAHAVYTGVLYQAANLGALDDDGMERARNSVLIFSALFGVTSPSDFIPSYRLKMGVKLPGGTPKSRWRALWHHLDERADGALVIDGRSSDYAGWTPPPTAVHVKIGAVRELGGTRKVITHNAKHYRGLFAGLALRAPAPPQSAEELAHLGTLLGDVGDIELSGQGSQLTLTVVERDERAA